MKMRTLVLCALWIASTVSQMTTPYISGNQFKNYYTNPNLINTFLSQLGGAVSPACTSIVGIGQPILAIKKLLQTVDTSLDSTNLDSNAKMIFFKEKKNDTTYQTNYKMVVQIKTYAANNYIAIEGLYKQIGFPTFEVLTYYVDSSIDNIRNVLNEYSVDPNAYVGCGDVKSIYSQANPVLPRPTVQVNGQQTIPSQTPYAQGNKLLNKPPDGKPQEAYKADPNVIAQVIQLLQKK